jgi:hypothetical protein
MIINIKVDYNDADFKYIKSEFDEADLDSLNEMIKILKGFKPYKIKYDGTSRHNFPWGNTTLFGLNVMCRKDLGQKSAYELYVETGRISEEVYKTFTRYLRKISFHTIHQIKIDKVVLYKKGV